MEAKTDQTPPSKGEAARGRILRAAAQLFVQNGYHNTGIREVIAAAHCSKGSFYFYFPSKEALGAAVLQFYQARLLASFREMAVGCGFRAFSSALMDFVIGNTERGINFGCPFAVLGMETAFTAPTLSRLSYEAMQESVAIFALPFLHSGLDESTAMRQAECAFACYEGYMLRYRLSGDAAELHKLREALEAFTSD